MAFNPPPTSPVERSLVIPPPVKGWNTRDPKSAMDPLFAVDIENYFPNSGTVDLRNGYLLFASSVGTGYVDSMASLEYGSVSKLVAVTDSSGNYRVFDASSGTGSDISGGVNFITPACQMLQFRDRLFIKPSYPTGTADVYHWTGTGNIVASAFTGPGGDDKDLLAIGAYKNRLYFGQYTAPSIWYGGVDAVTGALTEFPLTSVLSKGPTTILFVGSTARAKQYAEDDLLCIVTQAGEVLLYSGDYPGSGTWQIIGKYIIPPPVGPKGFFYSGSDLNIVTRLGVMSVKKMLSGDYANSWPSLSENIENEFVDAYSVDPVSFYINSGIAYPKGQYLLANYHAGNDVYKQLIMNTTTGAWTLFTNQNARSWGIWATDLYFGSSGGKIYKANTGYFDDNGSGVASSRTKKLRFAFNYFGEPTTRKSFVAAIPTVYQSEGLDITANIDVDYTDTTATSQETDTSKGTSYQIYQPRLGLVADSGNAGSFRIDGTCTTKRESIEAVKIIWNEGTDI